MNDDAQMCGLCGSEQKTDIAILCTRCSAGLHGDLRAVRTYLGLLRDAAARLARIDRRAGRNDDDVRRTLDTRYPLTAAASPSPVDFGAVDAADHLTRTVRAWTAHYAAERGHPVPQGHPGKTITPEGRTALQAAWLADRWRTIRTRPWAATCARDIAAAVRRAESHVDQPPPEHYAGHCDVPLEDPSRPGETFACGWELYARLGADVVRCRGCGTQHNVTERREQMLALAGNRLVTATTAARALTTPDREVTAAMVRGWKRRGGLEQAIEETPDGGQRPAYDDRGRPLYWLRDVQDADRRIRYGTTNSTGKAS